MPISRLNGLGLRETQIELIKSRRKGNTVTFMVYNDRFKAAYSRFSLLRYVHIIHIMVNTLGIIIANVLIYPKTHINEFFNSA